MRRMGWAVTVLFGALAGCGSDEETTVTVAADEAPAEVVVASVDPEHDGTVVMAGEYPVEVVAHESGQVYAYVLGDELPPDDVELTIEVPVERRQTGRPVIMRWDARQSRWEGRVRRLTIVPGAIDVHIVIGGAEYHGFVDHCVVAPAIEVHVHERGRRKHKHKHKHNRKHRRRGGVEIRFR